jgi:anti-sigma factor RsiW
VTCRELAAFILDYLSGELPGDVRRTFEHHLTICPNCVRYLEQYQATIELGRNALSEPDDGVPASVPEELVQAILTARRLDRD